MTSSLISALQKVKPMLKENHLIVKMRDLEIKLAKEEFINALFEEYQTMVEAEIEEWLNITFDTDFAGNNSVEENVFVIQEDTIDENGNYQFVFIGFYPGMKDSEDVPPSIEEKMNWNETKAWVEHVLCLAGKMDEIVMLEDKLRKEKEENENEWDEDREKVSAQVGDISIFPNSSIEYHSVWVENEKDNIMIPIEFNDLYDIELFIENEGFTSKETIHSVYRDSTSEYLVLSAVEEGYVFEFVDNDQKSAVKLSRNQAEQLKKEISKIMEHGHLV